jgi:hypothetical protein
MGEGAHGRPVERHYALRRNDNNCSTGVAVSPLRRVDTGGHIAAWEEPELFTTEIGAAAIPAEVNPAARPRTARR